MVAATLLFVVNDSLIKYFSQNDMKFYHFVFYGTPVYILVPVGLSISGKLKKNILPKDIIKSMMPGGSVIGCPKIRTLELLNKQEKQDRNIFTGSFGYIKFNKNMRFNIIIRSILNYKNISEISAASGVVLDSSSKKEFNENFIKAKSLLELYKWFI